MIVTASGSTDDGWQSDRFLTRRSICVGATDESDVVAPWTRMGSAVQVFAPGVEVSGALGGAAAGLVCGPGAPVCVTIGVFVGGALGAFGIDFGYTWLKGR